MFEISSLQFADLGSAAVDQLITVLLNTQPQQIRPCRLRSPDQAIKEIVDQLNCRSTGSSHALLRTGLTEP